MEQHSPIEAMPEARTMRAVDWVVGLDLSLTGTGVAIIGDTGIRTALIGSKGHKGATLAERAWRLGDLVRQIVHLIPEGALVVIEQPAYSQTGGSHHDRSGLWWLVCDYLHPFQRVVEVAPGTLKKYACGKGNAGKDQVLAAVIRRYPQVEVNNNNEADALVLAAMGARHLGHAVETETAAITQAMEVPRWAN